MARAKQIAEKLSKSGPGDSAGGEPAAKKPHTTGGAGVDHSDPKMIAQQIANSLIANRTNMLVSLSQPQITEEVAIPNKIVGLVIGKGGEMINKLQSETGAKIQVSVFVCYEAYPVSLGLTWN